MSHLVKFVWIKCVIAHFKMVPQNLPGGIEEGHKKCQTSLS